jgi:hypothetical protein
MQKKNAILQYTAKYIAVYAIYKRKTESKYTKKDKYTKEKTYRDK